MVGEVLSYPLWLIGLRPLTETLQQQRADHQYQKYTEERKPFDKPYDGRHRKGDWELLGEDQEQHFWQCLTCGKLFDEGALFEAWGHMEEELQKHDEHYGWDLVSEEEAYKHPSLNKPPEDYLG